MPREQHYKRILKQNAKGVGAPPQEEMRSPNPWLNPTVVLAAIGIVVAALIALLVANGTEVRRNLSDFGAWLRQDASYSGEWSNDSSGYEVPPPYAAKNGSELVMLKMKSVGGEIDGEITSLSLCQALPRPQLMIRGSNSIWGARIEAWDFVGGRVISFGYFKVRVNSEMGKIELKNEDSPSSFFPASLKLGNGKDRPLTIDNPDAPKDPAEAAINDQLDHGFCPKFLKMVESSSKAMKKPAK